MNNCGGACGAYLKRSPQPFTIFKLPTSLSLCAILFNPPPIPHSPSSHCQPRTIPRPAPPQFKIRAVGAPQFFTIHSSLFIIHCCAFSAYLKTPSATFHYSSNFIISTKVPYMVQISYKLINFIYLSAFLDIAKPYFYPS